MSGALNLLLSRSTSGGGGGGGGGGTFAASPSGTTFSASISGAGTATTPTCTISASGGTAPYTYAWTRTAGDTGTTISNASGSAVTWSRVYGPGSRSDTSTWKCVVSDSASNVITISGITTNTDNEGGL